MATKLKKTFDEAEAAVEDAAGRVAGAAEDMAESTARDISGRDISGRDISGGVAGAREAARDALAGAAEMTGEAIRKARDGAASAGEAVAAGAGAGLSALRDTAVERADGARESLTDAGDRLAATLRRAAEDETAAPVRSRVYASAADGVTSAVDVLRDRSVADLATDLRDLARRHPGAFMAAAAIAGFAAARFLRASAARHDAERRP